MKAYKIIRYIGIVVLLTAGFVQCSKINERTTDNETTNIFRKIRDNRSALDVIPLENNGYIRSDENLPKNFTDYGKTINAYLEPRDGKLIGVNTPVWLAFTRPNGTVEYRKLREGIVGMAESEFSARHRDSSTIVVNQRKNKSPIFREARYRRNNKAEEEQIRRLERQIREAALSGNNTDASRVKRFNKDIIYPSLLIQTSYKGAKMKAYELNYTEEIIYQFAFWNAVDLRFRQVNDPEIRFHISGIIIGLDPNATPYLRSDVVDAGKIWNEAKIYWSTMSQREDFPAKAYDIVVTITDADTFHSTPGLKPGAIAARTTCSHSLGNRFHSIAIVRDKGSFEGILTATHALGTFLGAEDDTNARDECDNTRGFIMDPEKNISPQNLEWSPCSLMRLSFWLRFRHENCFDKPAEFYPSGDPVHKVLPGDVRIPHKQCQGRGYDWACELSDICMEMECFYTNKRARTSGLLCQNTGPAAEGTRCASGHKCVEGLCQCMTADCLYIRADQTTRSP